MLSTVYGWKKWKNCNPDNIKDRTAIELLQIVRTAQKGLYVGKYEVLSGEASRKRRLSGF